MPCDPIKTDHEAVYCDIKCDNPTKPNVSVQSRSLKMVCSPEFQRDLQSIDWHSLYNCSDINIKLSIFNSKLLELFDTYCPIRTIMLRKPKPPWLTYNLKKMIELKHKAFCKFKKTKSNDSKNYYLQIKNIVNITVKAEKKAFYSMDINSVRHENNTGSLWDKIASWKLVNKKSKVVPPDLRKPDSINNSFLDNIPQSNVDPKVVDDFLGMTFGGWEPFQLNPATREDVLACVKCVKSNAVGVDGISIKMLKACLPYCLDPLVNIINYSLHTACVPDMWKLALITPIPKVNEPTDFTELRPISILPAASKVLEKIVKHQTLQYLQNKFVIPKFQSGFRANHSCTTALLRITGDIASAFDQGHCCPSVLIDMTKAFDSLDTALLIAKLRYYNMEADGWFADYLRNRKQAVRLVEECRTHVSGWRVVERGVPQGSILGPLLFTIFVSDLVNSIENCKYHMYADDLQIYLPTSNKTLSGAIDLMNADLSNISRWATKNSLLINPQKTQSIMYSRANVDVSNLKIMMGDIEVQWMDEVRNLGLYMDKKLTFTSHVNNICQRSFFRLKQIYEFRNVLPLKVKKILTESLILSIPGYLDIVYGPFLTNADKYRVQKIQNSCVRYVLNLSKRDHVSQPIADTFQCNMSQRRFAHMGVLIHKVINLKEPLYLSELIVHRGNLHNVNIRYRDIISIPQHRTEFYKSSFNYLAGYVYNSLPRELKECSGTVFKSKLKKFVLDHLLVL